MMQRSETIEQIATALALAQGELEAVTKDSENPHFQHRYAGLAAVYKALRGPFAKNGLAVVQGVASEGQRVTVTTMLLHKSGEYLSSDLGMTAVSLTPQAIGSAITYGRRYALLATAGLAPEDDDGEAASAAKQAQQAIAERKIRQAKDAGLKKAVPPEIPPMSPEESLGVGPHDISLEDRLQASVKQAQTVREQNASRKKNDSLFREMLDSFQHVKKELDAIGRGSIYYAILGSNGFEHSNEFQDMDTARRVYKEIVQALRDEKGMIDAREEEAAMRSQ